MPTPPIPCLRFAESLAVTAQDSGPSGSLLLPRKALSSSTSCRFIPAHITGHFIVLYAAAGTNDAQIKDSFISVFAQCFRAFLNAAFHTDALFPARLDLENLRDQFDPLHLRFGFL